ncbi:MAG: F0F1 ATP synthase subunit delta [Sphingomonadales bacterium]
MSSNKAISTGISGRYAKALFDLALEGKSIDRVSEDLEKIEALITASGDFLYLISSPIVSKTDQLKAVGFVSKELALETIAANFLGILAQNRRLGSLISVLASFKIFVAAYKGEVTADVVSAHPLSDAQTKALKKSLKATMSKEVNFDVRVDESLLGGLIVKIGSRMVDSSLKSKLENLKVSMKGV